MRNNIRVCTAVLLVSLIPVPVFAQAPPSVRQLPSPVPMPDTDKVMAKKPMSGMDAKMVKNCKQMPTAKMMADPECRDYLKNHPDWMKGK